MKVIRTVKLCTECKERATDLKGTITHWQCDMEGRMVYVFQPRGLSSEDGQPSPSFLAELVRLDVSGDCFENVEVPVEILGSIVKDKASGFTGMAVGFVRHPNGCFHVIVQPSGSLDKTKARIKARDFDLRQCEGPMITAMDEEALAKSKKANPSPTGDLPEREFSNSSSLVEF